MTKSHEIWPVKNGSNASSPIYHLGRFIFASTGGGVIICLDAASGKEIYKERLKPNAGTIYASPVLAGGNLYFVSQDQGVFVVADTAEFKLLAHNLLEDDKSRTNASMAVSNGQFLMRTDRFLYCIGKKP